MTSRYFFFTAYGSEDDIRLLLSKDYISHYAYIFHNNDKWLPGDCPSDHVPGDPKKEHWHILLYTFDALSPKTIYDYWGSSVAFVEACSNVAGAFTYMTHSDQASIDAGKWRYSVDDIRSDKLSFFSREVKAAVKKDKLEWYDEFVDQVIKQGCVKRSDLLVFSRKYGKDFGYNYTKALKLCCDVIGCDYGDIFSTPTERIAHNQAMSRKEYETGILEKYRDYAIESIASGVTNMVLDRFNDDFKKKFYD